MWDARRALYIDSYTRQLSARVKPQPVDYRIVFERDDDGVSVVNPAPHYVAMLRAGNIIRRLRVLADNANGKPIYDGDGALLPPMSEQEAIEFVAWRDVPASVQLSHATGNRPRIVICHKDQLPQTRVFRNAWRLSDGDH